MLQNVFDCLCWMDSMIHRGLCKAWHHIVLEPPLYKGHCCSSSLYCVQLGC